MSMAVAPTPSMVEKPAIRRCLFGPVDHAQMRRDLSALHKTLDQQAEERWGFNFKTETPLRGVEDPRYEWIPVLPRKTTTELPAVGLSLKVSCTAVPEELTDTATEDIHNRTREDARTPEPGQVAVPEHDGDDDVRRTLVEKRKRDEDEEEEEVYLHQSTITDFFPRKKNTHTTSTPTKRRRLDV